MSGSRKNQKTTTSPWSGQQPYLTDIFEQAQGLYQGGGPQYFGGQTVAQFDPWQQQGLGMQAQRGMQGSPYQRAMGNFLTQQLQQQNVNPQAFAPFAQQAAGGVGQGQQMLQAGGQPVGYGQAAGMAGLGGAFGLGGPGDGQQGAPSAQPFDPTAGQQLQQTAGGQFLGANPYLDQAFEAGASGITKQFEENVLPSIAAQFGAAGRTGGGAQALTTGRAAEGVTRQLQELAGGIYAPAYEAERGRQIQAAGTLGNLRLGAELGVGQQDIARRGLAADLFTGGQQRQLQGGQAMGQLGMQGIGALGDLYKNIGQAQFRAGSLAPSLQQMEYGDISQLLGAGGARQGMNQQNIDAAMQRWNYNQNLPWQNLSQYSNLINQLPGGLGTRTAPDPRGSRFSGIVGGAMSGAGMFPAAPWLGAAGGALLGGLA